MNAHPWQVMVIVIVLLGRCGFVVKAGRGSVSVVKACAAAAAAVVAAVAAKEAR